MFFPCRVRRHCHDKGHEPMRYYYPRETLYEIYKRDYCGHLIRNICHASKTTNFSKRDTFIFCPSKRASKQLDWHKRNSRTHKIKHNFNFAPTYTIPNRTVRHTRSARRRGQRGAPARTPYVTIAACTHALRARQAGQYVALRTRTAMWPRSTSTSSR